LQEGIYQSGFPGPQTKKLATTDYSQNYTFPE